MSEYFLLDFGEGRKLERFGRYVLDRPCPAAERARRADPDAWAHADFRYDKRTGQSGRWAGRREPSDRWEISLGDGRFSLKLTPFGHVGLFPEQLSNWQWIRRRAERCTKGGRVLNLFAYTGGSTLAAASGSMEVVHVDAAQNVVTWARQNAARSNLGDRPIRWIAEDARKFVQRELRRQQRYDALILDPPSFGHGPKAQVWKLSSDLQPLLLECRKLLSPDPAFILLTCHSPGYGPAELSACLQDAIFGSCQQTVASRELRLVDRHGRGLNAGYAAYWPTR